ncbi:capsule polysaccharide transporter [Methylopila jiangsuensis]|uniref:Capsule polysaccharide transporter n=1 Tax=Methylopila jiangsuensis TaxID=586230 RepID=A0A9W6JHI8_9HYPH|nr:hypothetical protein [Methylopila jiangsuensis]MDR6284863.1 capsular polysaccharide transport system permease protein [Methylopila jiangsuensis]GLK77746.1 capsule polysaccharide transporter [Methylopila jiangsuensis]
MTENAISGGSAARLGARARTVLQALSDKAPQAYPAAAEPNVTSPAPAAAAPVPVRGRRAAQAPAPSAPAEEPTPNKIVPLPRRMRPTPKGDQAGAPKPEPRPAATRAKKSLVKVSAMLAIGLPTALASLYYGFIAAPQYVVEAKFAIRGAEEASSSTLGGVSQLAGLNSPMAVVSDSYIVQQFIESRQLVEKLQNSVDLRAAYTRDGADFLARYRPYEQDTTEHLTKFWNAVSYVYYEPISGIISFNVRAFTPDDALKIARETVRESENLVNKLSERAREDAIFNTKQELSRTELRLKFARKAIQDYRDREGSVDPSKSAESQLTIISGLEGDLAKQEAEYASTSAFMTKDAPTMRLLKNRIDALRKRIDAEKAKVGSLEAQQAAAGKGRPLLSSSFAEYEQLETERDFAQKAYEAALTAVENARVRSERQGRYLATFVEPTVPQGSLYPSRISSVLLVALCSAIAWAIGVLIFYGIRDHSA